MAGRRDDEREVVERELGVFPERGAEFEDELREFLEADRLEVRADPFFRERLRRRLWGLLLERLGARNGSRGGGG
jgi:hypothetical protein